MLWLAIHLPQLPLDLLPAPDPGPAADATTAMFAIEESNGQARRVVACNEAASAQGVENEARGLHILEPECTPRERLVIPTPKTLIPVLIDMRGEPRLIARN